MELKFEPKLSGTKVTGFLPDKWLFRSQYISLAEVEQEVQRQETMDWILDTLRFSKGAKGWWTIIDHDSIIKLSILEYYPEVEEQMIAYFGESWLKHYIRFNH